MRMRIFSVTFCHLWGVYPCLYKVFPLVQPLFKLVQCLGSTCLPISPATFTHSPLPTCPNCTIRRANSWCRSGDSCNILPKRCNHSTNSASSILLAIKKPRIRPRLQPWFTPSSTCMNPLSQSVYFIFCITPGVRYRWRFNRLRLWGKPPLPQILQPAPNLAKHLLRLCILSRF